MRLMKASSASYVEAQVPEGQSGMLVSLSGANTFPAAAEMSGQLALDSW